MSAAQSSLPPPAPKVVKKTGRQEMHEALENLDACLLNIAAQANDEPIDELTAESRAHARWRTSVCMTATRSTKAIEVIRRRAERAKRR